MTTELHPLLLERTGGTPGASDAAGIIRRAEPGELLALTEATLAWMALESVLVRAAGEPTALELPLGSVLGRGATGSVRALTASDLDGLLSLTTRLAGKAPLVHGHAIAEVANLQSELNARAPFFHTHVPANIRAAGVPDGHVLTAIGQTTVFAAPTGGGGATLAGPLVGDLALEGFRILCGVANPVELIRCTGSRLYLHGQRYPILAEGTPAVSQVWIWNGSAWVHRLVVGSDVQMPEQGALTASHLTAQVGQLLTLLDGKAATAHTHPLSEVLVPAGATVGHAVVVGSGNTLTTAAVSGGGGIANPLTANLNISTFALVSGAQEVLKWAGGKVVLGGRDVIPAAIASPAAGHVPVYNAGTSVFENRILTAAEVSTTAISGVTGANVQAMLADIAGQLPADTDDVPEGATNKYVTNANIAAAGGLTTANRSDNEALGSSTTLVPTQRAVQVYVDTAVAAVGGGGMPAGTSFPGSPSSGDTFLRTDLGSAFVFSSGVSAWIALDEQTLHLPAGPFAAQAATAFTTSTGAYFFGAGNTLGIRLPYDVFLVGLDFQTVQLNTGEVAVRRAAFGDTVTDAMGLTLSNQSGNSQSGAVAIGAGELLSLHGKNFTTGPTQVVATIRYRRRVAV